MNFTLRKVLLPIEKKQIIELLRENQLIYEDNIEYSIMLFAADEFIGTGSISANVLKCITLKRAYRGKGLLAKIITHLLNYNQEREIFHNFIYTTPDNEILFQDLGFQLVGTYLPYVSLLEIGEPNLNDFLDNISSYKHNGQNVGIVVNCNPFTLGHQSLIEKAASENDNIYVFVVEEDKSVFPFNIRIELVRKGIAHLNNVIVLSGGKYIISNAIFPSYFLKDNISEIVKIQTHLDVSIWAERIAPILNITKRYVGEEPYCDTTSAYNKAMSDILEKYDIKLIVMKRSVMENMENKEIISASNVRQALKIDDWESVKKLVPKTTLSFLQSKDAIPIIEQIKALESRH